MYKTLIAFYGDMEGRHYAAGEAYPGQGVTATQARIDYLAGSQNRTGRPVILPVQAEKEKPAPKPVEKPARKRAAPQPRG